MASTAEMVAEQYPFFQFLLADPEVGPLLTRAVDPLTPYSPLKFQAELMNTGWFRTRSAKRREWEILQNTDPAEAWRRRQEFGYQVKDLTTKLGFDMTNAEWDWITNYNIMEGIEPGSAEFNFYLRNHLYSTFGSGVNRLVNGSILGAANQIHNMAKGEYFTHLPENDVYGNAIDLAMGYKDENAIRYMLQWHAQSRYPWLQEELGRGKTMRDLFSSHLQTIGDEWEVSPDSIDPEAHFMQSIIGRNDPGSGIRPASLYETKVLARRDGNFWKTSKSKQMDASVTNFLLSQFGKRA